MTANIDLRSNYLATQDAVLAMLNEHYLPDILRPSLTEGRWHYRPKPSQIKGVCSTQGSYRLHFRYGDIYALRYMAKVADALRKNNIPFEVGGIRSGSERKLVIMVPEFDMKCAIRKELETLQ